jgi:hypothetical protein
MCFSLNFGCGAGFVVVEASDGSLCPPMESYLEAYVPDMASVFLKSNPPCQMGISVKVKPDLRISRINSTLSFVTS